MTANELWAKLYMKAGDDRMFEVSHDNKPLGIMRNSSWNPYPNEYGVDVDKPPADGLDPGAGARMAPVDRGSREAGRALRVRDVRLLLDLVPELLVERRALSRLFLFLPGVRP